MNSNNNNNNNSTESSDELDALINGKNKLTDQEIKNLLTPTTSIHTETNNNLPSKEALYNLASPAQRLAAFIVDVIYFVLLVMLPYFILNLIAALTFIPQLLFSPTNEVDTSIFDSPLLSALTILPLLYVILQFLAFKRGTTLGHKCFNLYIISDKSGELAKFWRVFLREVVAKNFIYIISITALLLPPIYSFITPLYFLIIYLIIMVYFIIDNLFIFSYEKKTLHDRIAKTSVIKLPGLNKRNIIVLSIILGFTALIFIALQLLPLLLKDSFENIENEAAREANRFVLEINVLAAFTTQLDAKEQAIEAAEYLNFGSYSSGIFTSSNGISYQIIFNGDTATLGDIFEGEIPVANNQLTTSEPTLDNNQLPYNVSEQSYQEAVVFIKTVNALAAFTVELDAIEQAMQAIEDISLGSYSSGIFTSSDGTSYQIDFVGDTASLSNLPYVKIK